MSPIDTVFYGSMCLFAVMVTILIIKKVLHFLMARHVNSPNPTVRSIVDWLYRVQEDVAFAGMVSRYKDQGHPAPHSAACKELHIRANYLEEFRDFASYRFDLGFSLDEAKAEYIKTHLSKGCFLDKVTAALVRQIIQDMPADEAYHAVQYKRWCDEADAIGRELMKEAHERYGPSGLSPLQRRVLRSGS